VESSSGRYGLSKKMERNRFHREDSKELFNWDLALALFDTSLR
jgi:hypothetical protein